MILVVYPFSNVILQCFADEHYKTRFGLLPPAQEHILDQDDRSPVYRGRGPSVPSVRAVR